MTEVREKVRQAVKANRLIAIMRGATSDNVCSLVMALYAGGVRVAEITFGNESDEATIGIIKKAVSAAPSDMYIGAGTVTTHDRLEGAYHAGCKFLVSPICDQGLVNYCRRKGIASVIGAFSPTEIKFACDCGANFVKIFPARAVGPEYFSDLKAPFGELPLIAFGGVDENNAVKYLSSGAVAVGVGSAVCPIEAIKSGNFELITKKAAAFTSMIKGLTKTER